MAVLVVYLCVAGVWKADSDGARYPVLLLAVHSSRVPVFVPSPRARSRHTRARHRYGVRWSGRCGPEVYAQTTKRQRRCQPTTDRWSRVSRMSV